MGWFDSQLDLRKQKDDENFSDAITSIAGAVMGKRLAESLNSKDIAKTAIQEILRYYHRDNKMKELPQNISSIEDQLDFYMTSKGIMRRQVILPKGWYKDAIGAMLTTLKEDGRAVALIPNKFSGYSFIDFKTGQKVRLNKKTENLIDNEATCFYRPLPLRKIKIKDLLLFMFEDIKISDIIFYLGMMLLTTLLGLIPPRITQLLFGDVLNSGETRYLIAISIFLVCFTAAKLLFTVVQAFVNSRINTRQDISVRAAVMSRLMSLEPGFFKKYSSGELTQRSQYIQSLCTLLMNSLANTGITSIFSLIYIGQIFTFAPSLVAPSLSITAITIIFSIVMTFTESKILRKQMEASSVTSGLTYSTITGIQKIKLAGAEKRMFSRWAKTYAKEAQLEYNPPIIFKLNRSISLAISLIGTLVLYYFAVKGKVNVADYYAFNSSYGMVSAAFMSLASIASAIARIKPTIDLTRPILEAEPEVSENKFTVSELKGDIEISHVSFRYAEDMPYVIDDLSLRIKPGEFLAVVGQTGCGKSTLMRLLLGFEKPQKGAIYYDHKDMNTIDVKSLRRKIGTVMQDSRLLFGDIYENIVISAPQLTLNEAWEAAEIASIADDIRALPMGMQTIISEGQGGISGGQRQRLMIARAIAPKPKILIFDEATSALDNLAQKKVTEAIDQLKCTRIIVAHRLSTIKQANRIIFLKGGKIVEDGTYDELIAKNGYFADLVARQRLDVDSD